MDCRTDHTTRLIVSAALRRLAAGLATPDGLDRALTEHRVPPHVVRRVLATPARP